MDGSIMSSLATEQELREDLAAAFRIAAVMDGTKALPTISAPRSQRMGSNFAEPALAALFNGQSQRPFVVGCG